MGCTLEDPGEGKVKRKREIELKIVLILKNLAKMARG
jgi:hypothetical protein